MRLFVEFSVFGGHWRSSAGAGYHLWDWNSLWIYVRLCQVVATLAGVQQLQMKAQVVLGAGMDEGMYETVCRICMFVPMIVAIAAAPST